MDDGTKWMGIKKAGTIIVVPRRGEYKSDISDRDIHLSDDLTRNHGLL